MRLSKSSRFKLIILAGWLALIAGVPAGLLGCAGTVRPFTRVAYQEYAWLPEGDESVRTQAFFLTAGPSYSAPRVSVLIGAGANLTALDGDWVEPGGIIYSEAYFGFDDNFKQYIYTSLSLTHFETGQEVYGYVSWHRTW